MSCRTYCDGEYLPHRWCLDRIRPRTNPKGIRRCNMRQRWWIGEGFGLWDGYGAVSPWIGAICIGSAP